MVTYQVDGDTFLYINGIKPREAVRLDDDVVLLPSSCNPTPDEIMSKCSSEVDIGVACLFLRSVSACFSITGATPKEVGSNAWNAQWHAILLGALFDFEVGFNFQCDVAPDEFSKAKALHVTNYALKGLCRGSVRELTTGEHRWMINYYNNADKLMNDDRFKNAVHCLSSYRWHSMPRAQMALIWSGIEGIFEVYHELSFRLSLYIAIFLYPRNRTKRKSVFDEVKKLYEIRSKAVHGGRLKKINDSVERSAKILRLIVLKSTEKGVLPKSDELYP